MFDSLLKSVVTLPGVGKKYASFFQKQGVETIFDLLFFFPRRWIDRSKILPIREINREAECVTIFGKVKHCAKVTTGNGKQLITATITDGESELKAVWFNRPFLARSFLPARVYAFSGKIVYNRFERLFTMDSPDFEEQGKGALLHTGRIVPIYPGSAEISEKKVRQIMWNTIVRFTKVTPMQDWFSGAFLERNKLVNIAYALYNYHFPNSREDWLKARMRLAFDEAFLLQLLFFLRRKSEKAGVCHLSENTQVNAFIESLPFVLTDAQERVVREIISDMEDARPMRRLVQGDVGSGKTAVAAIALCKTVAAGFQGALMAPTEILAEQHFHSLTQLFAPHKISVGLLVGSMGIKEREIISGLIAQGKMDIVIGTHALIQENVRFKKLGLAVVDEQHRFGVHQRFLLEGKGENPDVLVMSATPIPRTLALTLYGQLDVSVIDKMPPGRQTIETYLVAPEKRKDAYRLLETEAANGRQVYYVCPFVEESDFMNVRAVEQTFGELQKLFPTFSVGLIHGKLKTAEKEKIMDDFAKGLIQILVATTIIEVGINNPNASVIVIEDAERFGLSQLHQLRGRVGRGKYKSYCILFSNAAGDSLERLRVMERTLDGFAIAEEDLKFRGQGEFFGDRQHGAPKLKILNLHKDLRLIEKTRQEAKDFVSRNPNLAEADGEALKRRLSLFAATMDTNTPLH